MVCCMVDMDTMTRRGSSRLSTTLLILWLGSTLRENMCQSLNTNHLHQPSQSHHHLFHYEIFYTFSMKILCNKFFVILRKMQLLYFHEWH